MANVEVKIVWFSSQNSAEAEKTIAELLSDGWKITHVSGGGSDGYSFGITRASDGETRLRAMGFVILERHPRGGGTIK
jgi:hypothetical protein